MGFRFRGVDRQPAAYIPTLKSWVWRGHAEDKRLRLKREVDDGYCAAYWNWYD
jgi:hypothetical protein